jgi:hypothetical protein
MSETATLDAPTATRIHPKQQNAFHNEARDFAFMVDRTLHYKHHPVHYVERMILPGHPGVSIQPHQADILDAVAEHDRIGISAGNGMGKDTVSAWLIEWFLMTRPLARIPCTSGVGRQVKEILFAEVHKWSSTSLMRQWFELQTTAMRVRGYEEFWYAVGFSSASDDPGQKEAKAEGWHEEHLLFVMTEARAVDDHIWDAARKACTQLDNKIFAQSVKGVEHGEFFQVFTRDRSTWKTFSFPDAKLNPEWTPQSGQEASKYLATSPLVSQKSIQEKFDQGEDAPVFRAGVLDLFIKGSAQGLISLEWLNEARNRHLDPVGPREFGGDVAEGGDASALCERCGPVVLSLAAQHIKRIPETSGWFIVTLRQAHERWLALPEEERATEPEPLFRVDSIGVGAGVVGDMEEVGANVRGINVGLPASDPEKYANLKAEIFWALRCRAENGALDLSRIPELEFQLLVEDLTTMRYRYTNTGKVQLEEKKETRKRLGRSPDRADAMALAFMPASRKLKLYEMIFV